MFVWNVYKKIVYQHALLRSCCFALLEIPGHSVQTTITCITLILKKKSESGDYETRSDEVKEFSMNCGEMCMDDVCVFWFESKCKMKYVMATLHWVRGGQEGSGRVTELPLLPARPPAPLFTSRQPLHPKPFLHPLLSLLFTQPSPRGPFSSAHYHPHPRLPSPFPPWKISSLLSQSHDYIFTYTDKPRGQNTQNKTWAATHVPACMNNTKHF